MLNMFVQPARLIRMKIFHSSVSGTCLWNKDLISLKQGVYQCNVISVQDFGSSGVSFNKTSSLIENLKQELTIFKSVDFGQLKCAPLPAVLYGGGGILPFVFPPIYFMLESFSPFLATAQLLYGATILAFIGGVKWGNALAKDNISHEQIGVSTIPSLVAWGSLLLPEPIGFMVVSSGLIGALYVDLKSSNYSPWFCALRSTLTGVAVTSLMITLFFHVLK